MVTTGDALGLRLIGILKLLYHTKVYRGLRRDNGKEHGNYYRVFWGYIGIMEKIMETAI